MNVEKEILDPHSGVCCAIVLLDVDGFKPFWEFMFHYFISEAGGVGASMLGFVAA